jgi:hypothetical protein
VPRKVTNALAQFFFNGLNYKRIDLLDVGVSALSGKSFLTSGIIGGLYDWSLDDGFSTAVDKGVYETSVDIGTGTAFGGANFIGTEYLAPGIGGVLGYGLDFTIQSYGELFNSTLSNPR